MAINSAVVWEVRTGGSDANNGGGFKTGATGTDRSQQDAAHATLTTASTVHTTTTQINVAAGDYTVTSADVGNVLVVNGGTATAGRYEITAVDTGNNRWTVDRSVGTSAQTVVGGMGGALASPGMAGAVATVIGQDVWIKAGTYNISTNTLGSNGPVSLSASGSSTTFCRGYDVTRGDDTGTKPLLVWTAAAPGVATGILASSNSGAKVFFNLKLDCNSTSNVQAVRGSWSLLAFKCHAVNAVGTAFVPIDSRAVISHCFAESCGTGFSIAQSYSVSYSYAKSCTTGFSMAGGRAYRCAAHSCTTAGFSTSGGNTIECIDCMANGTSAGSGFVLSSESVFLNCLSTNNSAYGFSVSGSGVMKNCGSYNNTSGRVQSAVIYDVDGITLTADPYVNLAGEDFRPNTTAGGGALLRAAGIGVYSQIDNSDVGAVQKTPFHQYVGMVGGMAG